MGEAGALQGGSRLNGKGRGRDEGKRLRGGLAGCRLAVAGGGGGGERGRGGEGAAYHKAQRCFDVVYQCRASAVSLAGITYRI